VFSRLLDGSRDSVIGALEVAVWPCSSG